MLFASSRIRKGGEWFKPTSDLLDFIAKEQRTNPMAIVNEVLRVEPHAMKEALDLIEQQAAMITRLRDEMKAVRENLRPNLETDRRDEPLPLAVLVTRSKHAAIERALAACNGNRSAAARMLGINERTVFRFVAKHHATPPTHGLGRRR